MWSPRAGVAKTTVYRWWPHKSHLVIEAVGTQLQVPLQTCGDTRTDIRALIEHTIEFVGGTLGEIPTVDLTTDRDAGVRLAELLGPYRAAHAAVLLAAAARGDLPHTIDASATLDLITGAVLFRKIMKRPLDATFANQLTALVLAGQIPCIPDTPPV